MGNTIWRVINTNIDWESDVDWEASCANSEFITISFDENLDIDWENIDRELLFTDYTTSFDEKSDIV